MNTQTQLLRPLTIETALPGAAAIMTETKSQIGFVPNMYATMANSPEALAAYTLAYSDFREQSTLSQAEQEILFLTVSRENGCEYCVAAHSMIGEKMSGVKAQTLEAIRNSTTIEDLRDRALSEFATQMLITHGRPTEIAIAKFFEAGFTPAQILEVVTAIAIKTISNYSNHITDPELDPAFSAYAWKACK